MTDDALTARLAEVARQVVDETPGQQFATARRIHETLAREQRTRKHRIQIVSLAFAGVCALAVVAHYAGWQPDPPPDEASNEAPVATPDQAVATSMPPSRAPSPSLIPPAPPEPALSPTPVPVPAPVMVPAPAPPRSPVPTRPVPRPSPQQLVPAKRPAVPAPVRPEAIRAAPALPSPAPAAEPVHPADSGTPAGPDASEELKSYSRAHDAYFHGGDPAAALAAWDAYLASYPSGQLVLEARYARALVLIKLERWTEAAAALRPFASAPAGSYRQAEAARLLTAMPGH